MYDFEVYKDISIKLVISTIIIVVYGFSSVFSISHAHNSASHSHSSHSETSGCVYMIGERGLCSMTIFDHLNIWQSFSSAYIPILVAILSALSFLLVFLIFSPPPKRFCVNKIFIPSLYQSLFSQGILNPKLF